MRVQDVFTARSVAVHIKEDPSNKLRFVGEQFFKPVKQAGIDLKWIKGYKGVGTALKASTFDARSTIRTRKGFSLTKQEMPLFRESMMISEQDMIEIDRAQNINDPYLAPVLNDIYNDVDSLVDGADIAVERMRMQLLSAPNGDVKISIGMEDNTAYTYNYDPNGDWKADHYVALSGTAQWKAANKATATPLRNINERCEFLRGKGYNPQVAMMNSTTFNEIIDCDEMRNAFISSIGVTVAVLDKQTAIDLFEKKTGLMLILNDKHYLDTAGNDAKFYPDNYVSIIAGQMGETHYGTTPEERTLISDPSVDVAIVGVGVAVCKKTEYGPPVMHSTTVSEVALPSFEGMDGLCVIKVA